MIFLNPGISGENPVKFGTDGYRGIIAKDFTVEKVVLISQGVSDYINQKKDIKGSVPKVVFGFDCRFLSDLFAKTAAMTFASNKILSVISDDFVSSPMVSNSAVYDSADLGIMITASHNPYIYNGFKIKGPFGGSATMDIINDVEVFVNKTAAKGFKALQPGLQGQNIEEYFKKADFLKSYKKQIYGLIDSDLFKHINIPILIDPMYGSARKIFPEILDELKISNYHIIHDDFNPGFGGINPEPIGKNIEEAGSYLLKNNLKMAVCVDGDADRIGVIGEEGNFISSHHIFAIVLYDLIKNRKIKGRVIKTVTTSSIIERMALKNNLELVTTPVGFKYIAEEILKGGVIMGGEESGGLWTYGNLPERDGILMGLKLLEIMAREKKTLNEILKEIYDDYGYFVFLRNDYEIPEGRVKSFKEKLESSIPLEIEKLNIVKKVTIDGYKYILADGSWIMIRPSGTEAVVRVYGESSSPQKLEMLMAAGKKVIEGEN